MSLPSWKSQFSQPISGYNPVEAQGLSELGYALLHNQISEEEYLKWARESFEFCSVDVKFFQTHPAPRKLYEKVKDAYAWGPECMPIGEWENCLLIAGIEKPTDIPPELNPVFLLAPIKSLSEYWSAYSSEEPIEISESGAGAEETSGMPDGMNIDVTASAPSADLGLSFSGIGLAQVKDVPAPAPEKPKQPNVDLYATQPIPVPGAPLPIDRANIQIPTSALEMAVAKIEETKPGIQVPKTSNPPAPKVTTPVQAIPSIPKAKPADPITEQIAIKVEEAVKVEETVTRSERTPPLTPKTPPPAKEAKPKLSTEDTDVVTKVPTQVLESTIPEIKAKPQAIPPTPPAAASQEYLPDEALQKTFAECKKHYEKLLFVDFQNSTKLAVAQRWPPDFVATQQPTSYSLEEDSFLSIVYKTQKPYHGYVIPNGVSKKFFEEVNSGQVPENITLVPVMQKDIVIGAIMGWGPKSTYTLPVLRDMEKAVNLMCLSLGWVVLDAA